MEEQKAKARAAWSGSGDAATEKIWYDILDDFGPTEFLGYEVEAAEGQILAIVKDGHRAEMLKSGEEGYIITNQTPFYAESGGQVGDKGNLTHTNGDIEVIDTKKFVGSIFAHRAQTANDVKVGENVQMEVNHMRRSAIRANHSATHLMHEALRRVLGDHVAQKGSLQDAQRTRFDISHPKAIKPEEIARVEEIVAAEIKADTPVTTRLMGLDEARETGAMALFGEKYDSEVRVVAMGTKDKNREFSIELCGGTHVKKTGEIGPFKIISESALSAGVRRLEAITGEAVEKYKQDKQAAAQAVLDKLAADYAALCKDLEALGGQPEKVDLGDEEALRVANKKLQKQISDQRRKQGASASDNDIKDIGGVKFIGKVLEDFPPKDLKPMADDLKKKLGSGVIALVATNDGKASIVVAVTEDLTAKINAVDLVKLGAEKLGGKGGGGRPDMAQAGGPDASAANDAVTGIEKAMAG